MRGGPGRKKQGRRYPKDKGKHFPMLKLLYGCHIITNIRVFDYERPNKVTLAVGYSVTANLERTGYQQLLPSFAYPPALLQDFGSEEETKLMFRHIARTYLSTRYRKSRDWHNFVRHRTTDALIASWIAELSDTRGVYALAHIRPTTKGQTSTALQVQSMPIFIQ